MQAARRNRVRNFAELFMPQRVMFEQLQPLLDGGHSTLVANAIVALIVGAVINSPVHGDVGTYWAASCIVIVLCSAVVLRVVKQGFNSQDQKVIASWLLTIAGGFRGLIWGLCFILLMPKANNYEQIMLGWVLAGVMCGGAFSAWSHPAAAMIFSGLVGLGGFIGMLGVPDVGNTWMPFAVPVFFIFLLRAVMVSVNAFRKSVQAEKELAAKNGVIGLLLKDFEENASDWLWETDERGILTRGVERFARLLEISPDKIKLKSFPMLVEIHGAEFAANSVFKAKLNARESFGNQVIGLNSGSMERFLKISAKPKFDADGTLWGWHGVASDVTDERLADMKVRKLALFDSLTELPNRAFFHDRLDASLEARARGRSWVIYLDLDGFKHINDTFGHAVGDNLLRCVATRLSSCLPAKGMLARLGGDEFAVVCAGDRERILSYAEQMITATELPFVIGHHDLSVGVSLGIAELVDAVQGRDEWTRRADVALYAAKHAGRGVARIYDDAMDVAQTRKRKIEQALRKALAMDHFVLHYQPIVDIKTGKTHAYEALLRLETAELGAIPPSDFIPIAEETGLITDVGNWVIRHACLDAARWPNSICVAVNVSPLQLKSHRILATVTDALAQSGLVPARLELELTESALVDNLEHTARLLADLKNLGVRLALDDFGTGYSSLAHLHQFNFDKIKIDRSFVQTFGDRRESTAVVNAVALLARDLGITMTAEGVETVEHMNSMRDLGIDQAQGYYLGRPAAEPTEAIDINAPKRA